MYGLSLAERLELGGGDWLWMTAVSLEESVEFAWEVNLVDKTMASGSAKQLG